MAEKSARQQRIMDHVARSTGDFIKLPPQNSSQRKQQILDHIRLTRG